MEDHSIRSVLVYMEETSMRNKRSSISRAICDARDMLKLYPSNKNRTDLTKLFILNGQMRICRAERALDLAKKELITNPGFQSIEKISKIGKRLSKAKRNQHSRVVKAETAFRLGVLDGDTLNYIQNLQNAGIHNGRYTLTKDNLSYIALSAITLNRSVVPTN